MFNLYSEAVFNKALENTQTGMKIDGNCLNNLCYSDDIVVIASSLTKLQGLMNCIVEHSKHYGLYMNTAKIILLVFLKTDMLVSLTIHEKTIKQAPFIN